MQLFQTPNIDFISRRRVAYLVSASVFLIGMGSLIMRGGPNLGIDFKGGTSVMLEFDWSKDVTIGNIRQAITASGLGNSEIKSTSRDQSVEEDSSISEGDQSSEQKKKKIYIQIYVEQQKGVGVSEMRERVEGAIKESFSGYRILKTETVGPRIGEELRKKVIQAILISLLLILVYIGWRFELVFSVGAIAALFHDVLITLGIFSLMNFQISIKEIAAFLTIVGYSLNDTIVVYDRIRENLKVLRSENLTIIINKSINQCLSRTIITSLTTFVVVLILFIFGGEIIKGFAFTMLIGVIVGTYSSIFVASPIVLEWQMRHGGKRELKMVRKKKR